MQQNNGKNITMTEKSLEKAFNRVAHVKAMSALEGDPNDEYMDYLLLLKASDKISREDYFKAGDACIDDGVRLY